MNVKLQGYIFSCVPIHFHYSWQVNNSGATWGEALETYPDSAWSKLLTLNVQRVFSLTQGLLPMLRKAGEGDGVARVINVG